MALTTLKYIKLLDVPYLKDESMYSFLLQLKRVLDTMAGEKNINSRIITAEDLYSLGIMVDDGAGNAEKITKEKLGI